MLVALVFAPANLRLDLAIGIETVGVRERSDVGLTRVVVALHAKVIARIELVDNGVGRAGIGRDRSNPRQTVVHAVIIFEVINTREHFVFLANSITE